MTFIQEWAAPTSAGDAQSRTTTGAATAVGNTLFLDVAVRGGSIMPYVSVTDNASNTWTLVGSAHEAAANIYMYMSANAQPVTSVTASWVDDQGQPFSAPAIIMLSEYSDVGPLAAPPVTAAITNGSGGLPASTVVETGQLMRGVAAVAATTRTWELASTGVAPTARTGFSGGQTQLLRADAYAQANGSAAIGWNLVAGNPIAIVVINATFASAEDIPESEYLPMASANGWSEVVGETSRLSAISDDLDDSYVETGEDPAGEIMQLTLPSLMPPTANLSISLRLSSSGSSGTVTPEIYIPSSDTWLATTAISVQGPATTYQAVWTLASLSDITPDQWASGVSVRLVAQAGQ